MSGISFPTWVCVAAFSAAAWAVIIEATLDLARAL